MTMVIILLATLLLVFQLVISNVLKNSIYRRKYKYYMLLLILDYFFSCMFIVSVRYMWNSEIQKMLLLLDQFGLALFFLFYMKTLNPEANKRTYTATGLIALGSIFNVMLGSKLNPIIFIVIMIIVIITSYFILLPKIKQSSYRLTVILSLLLFTEMVRYLTSSLVTYQFIYIDMEFLWIAILPLVIKTLSTFLIVEVNDKLLLGNDLQKCVEYIRPSDFLSTTFMEHPDAVVLTDIDLNIVFVNPKALENTGY